MNRADLIGMVKNHSWSGEIDSSGLKELISLYPWFQSVYILLLDAQYSSDSISFEESLKKNAVYIANREVLYYILKETDKKLPVSVQGEQAFTVEEHHGTDDEGLRSKEELRAQIEARLAELESGEKEEKEDPADQEEETVDKSWKSNGILVLDEEEEIVPGFDDSREPETITGSELLDLDYPHEEDERQTTKGEGHKAQDARGEEYKESKEESRTAKELIDRFIDLNPRIEPDRKRMEEPIEDIAEKLEDKDPGLITETLARIYINQKFYTRAILIYEKLSLKFPEKSSYFATQIEKIKELMS